MRTSIQNIPYAMSLRMGLAFNRRFWEQDDWIYGGQSFFNVPEINIIHYPDIGFNDEQGVLLGMYNFGVYAAEVSGLPNQDRIEIVLDYGSRIHPTYRDDFHSGISVAWHRMPYALGAWPDYTATSRALYYPRLIEPDGRVYLVGEHLSYVNGWIEGALQAAWYQVERLHERVMQSS
jgi:monoamine oxidase